MLGLIGKKVGMTQLFDDDGKIVPVTVIEAGPCPIVQVKTEERDGYLAVQLGFGARKPRRANKPESGHAALAGLDYQPAHLREFRLGEEDELADDPHSPAVTAAPATEAKPDEADAEAEADGEAEAGAEAEDEGASEAEANGQSEPAGEGGEVSEAETAPEDGDAAAEPDADLDAGLRVGQVLTVSIFEPGERVKVRAKSKGRGFQGVVKRHGFRGFPSSHGHPVGRVPGSIGPGTDPSRVIKGRKMGGRMGGKQRTVRNLEVVRVDRDRNMLFVRGSVPGARNGMVVINKQ